MNEQRIFLQVQPTEFLVKAGWSNKGESTPNIQYLISRFNEVSIWVTTEIVKSSAESKRRTIERFIKLANEMNKINNFNGVMEIISGLNNSASRLFKSAWSNVSPKALKKFDQLNSMMDPIQNFKAYRKELEKRKGPTIPYMPIYLRDFTFAKEGNDEVIEDSLNMDLMRVLYSRVVNARRYQEQAYRFTVDPILEMFLQKLDTIEDEEQLFELASSSSLSSSASNSSRVSYTESDFSSEEFEDEDTHETSSNESNDKSRSNST